MSTMDGRSQTLPALYAMPAANFHDITSGNNNGHSAGPGYDMVTGIGSPVANMLVPAFVPVSSKGTVAFSTSSYEIGTSATITVGDLDLAGNSSCPVTLTSSAGDIETVNLPAVGGGVFKGSIVTSAGTDGAGRRRLGDRSRRHDHGDLLRRQRRHGPPRRRHRYGDDDQSAPRYHHRPLPPAIVNQPYNVYVDGQRRRGERYLVCYGLAVLAFAEHRGSAQRDADHHRGIQFFRHGRRFRLAAAYRHQRVERHCQRAAPADALAPTNETEGVGTVTGTVNIPAALGSDLTVT